LRPSQQHIGGTFSHHDNGGVGITAELVRKRRRIDHAQTVDSADAKFSIEYRLPIIVGADTTGRNRVVSGGDMLT